MGYIGLPTAALLSANGMSVIGVDVQPSIVDGINSGTSHIQEPMVAKLVKDGVSSGKLRAVLTPPVADVFIIAVPTPVDHASKVADLSYINDAMISISRVLNPNNLVILESTSPVGTTKKMRDQLKQLRPDLNFDEGDNAVSVTYCPERILPGTALEELVNNDRIIGAETKASADKAEDLYRVFVKGKIVTTTWEVAEISKLAENSFRDVNIAFANELSRVCDEANVNFWEVQKCTNLHPRVNILNAGPGVGGHCIPVDPWFLIEKFPNVSSLMRTAREVNDDKAKYVADKVLEAVAIILSNGTKNKEADISINIFGYAYKENVGDTRESPSKIILKHISSQFSGKINVFDHRSSAQRQS